MLGQEVQNPEEGHGEYRGSGLDQQSKVKRQAGMQGQSMQGISQKHREAGQAGLDGAGACEVSSPCLSRSFRLWYQH